MRLQESEIGQFTRRTDCRFCQGESLEQILDFGNVPLAGGFLREDQFDLEKVYPLDLSFCLDCGLVQVSNVVSAEKLFKNYFYFSSSIQTLVTHMADYARDVYERFLGDKKNPSVFELGCNDGVLLKHFAALGAKAVGVDPATNVVNSIDSNDITVINDFFSEKVALEIKEKYGLNRDDTTLPTPERMWVDLYYYITRKKLSFSPYELGTILGNMIETNGLNYDRILYYSNRRKIRDEVVIILYEVLKNTNNESLLNVLFKRKGTIEKVNEIIEGVSE